MKLSYRHKIRLIVKGIPIVSEHLIILTEEHFKEYGESKFASEDDFNPFSLKQEPFLGTFHGYYGREFSIKPKGSFFRKDSTSNSIWIHGKIEPSDTQGIFLNVSFYRTNATKYGLWLTKGLLAFTFLILCINALVKAEYYLLILFSATLVMFYLFILFILISQASDQIKYFQKYFLEEIEESSTLNV
ncbi:MAG: hypothetical protein AAF487_09385 [Bacteroidota bacterium]